MEYQTKHTDPARLFRAAILNGMSPREQDRVALEARGINTDELEARIRQSVEFKH